jgi:HEAT repeat protein
VRGTAAEALVKIGSDKGIEPLIAALQDTITTDLRRTAAEALGKIGSDKAVEPLIAALQDTTTTDLRRTAAEALGKIGSDKAVEPLIAALQDATTTDYLREKVAEALGKIGSDKAVEPLIAALQDTTDYVVESVIEALINLHCGKVNIVIFGLLEILENNNNHLCATAAKALGEIGGDMAVRGLIPLLQDNVFSVQHNATEALSKIASPMLINYLYRLIPATYGINDIPLVITAIQSRCKYYNYDIAQTPLPPEDNPNPTTGNTYNFNAPVGQVVENLTVQRDNIATQNNQKTAPES